jgi:hypothetical protein
VQIPTEVKLEIASHTASNKSSIIGFNFRLHAQHLALLRAVSRVFINRLSRAQMAKALTAAVNGNTTGRF